MKQYFSILALLIILSGCAAVKPVEQQPFEDYQSAISQLKDKTDQALQQAADTELTQFKAKVSADPKLVTGLMLEFPPKQPFGWCYESSGGDTSASTVSAAISAASATTPGDESVGCDTSNAPLFAKMAQMQQTLETMNTVLLTYAGLLVSLSGADEKTQFDAAGEAQKFDSAATSMLSQLNTLGVSTTSISSQDVALFSTIASNLAANYLENKRKRFLGEVLSAGQKPIKQFVELAQQALQITATSIITQYQNEAFPAVRSVVTSEGDASEPLDTFLGMNTKVQQQLDLLNTLNNSYGALLNAQGQLIAALNESRRANLAELIVYADNIKQQYEALKASTASSTGGNTE
ncbi:MAG: hypothetical protein Tsb002_11720 [Wenzhouxiangellaceae bacterium]